MFYRFGYLFYPLAWRSLGSVAAHLSLPLVVWLWMGAPMAWFVVIVTLWAFGVTGLIQGLASLLDRPPVDIQQLRVLRLVYPVLLGGVALAYAQGGWWLLPLMLVPPAWIVGWLHRGLRLTESAPHHLTDGEGFKAGALAYLQGTGRLVAWYRGMIR